MNEEKKRPEQETKAPAQIDITHGEPTAPAAEEPIPTEESPAAEAPQTDKNGKKEIEGAARPGAVQPADCAQRGRRLLPAGRSGGRNDRHPYGGRAGGTHH